MNKIESSTPKISLINNIGTPHNSPIKYTPAISDSGANTHIDNESKATMKQVIMQKK